MSTIIHLYTDGACRGNPGPGGWGALLRYQGHEKELSGGMAHTTNNQMELMGVIEGLKSIKKPSTIHVFTDSKYVQEGISKWIHNWIKKNWITSTKQPVKNQELWQTLYALTQPHEIQWFWVKGHNGHPENERVDQLARAAIERL
jgi:ribonuclease HI